MDFNCTVNIRYLVIYFAIAILCLTFVGIISIIKIDFEIHLRDGCEEPLENIDADNV